MSILADLLDDLFGICDISVGQTVDVRILDQEQWNRWLVLAEEFLFLPFSLPFVWRSLLLSWRISTLKVHLAGIGKCSIDIEATSYNQQKLSTEKMTFKRLRKSKLAFVIIIRFHILGGDHIFEIVHFFIKIMINMNDETEHRRQRVEDNESTPCPVGSHGESDSSFIECCANPWHAGI